MQANSVMKGTWVHNTVPMTPNVQSAPHGMTALPHGRFVTALLRLVPFLLPCA